MLLLLLLLLLLLWHWCWLQPVLLCRCLAGAAAGCC
jgi:hypothetical protein